MRWLLWPLWFGLWLIELCEPPPDDAEEAAEDQSAYDYEMRAEEAIIEEHE